MKLTLTDAGTPKTYRNGAPVPYRIFSVVEKRIVELHGQLIRPSSVAVHSNGDVWVTLIFVTKRGADFKSGDCYRLSLAGMRQRNTLPQVRRAITEAMKDLCRVNIMDVQVGDRVACEPHISAVKIEDDEDGSRRIIFWSDGETTLVNVQYPFDFGILPRAAEVS